MMNSRISSMQKLPKFPTEQFFLLKQMRLEILIQAHAKGEVIVQTE